MLCYVKSCLQEDQMDARHAMTSDGVELHIRNVEELQAVDSFLNYPIRVIHFPIEDIAEEKEYEIEGLLTDVGYQRIKEFLKVSSIIAEKLNLEELLLVMHGSISLTSITNQQRKMIQTRLHQLLNQYPNLAIGYENSTPLRYGKDGALHACENLHWNTVDFISFINHPRFGAVLDICHLMIEQKQTIGAGFKPKSVKESMEHFQPHIRLIHMCSMSGNGYGKGHGVPFSDENIRYLEEVLRNYKELSYDCPMTLEVREDDYLSPINHWKIETQVRQIWEQLQHDSTKKR